MNAHEVIAVMLAAATLPFVPSCTVTTAGRADLDRVEWLEDYDQKAATSAAERSARPTTTPAPSPRMPEQYRALSDQIQDAATQVKVFWESRGIDLGGVQVVMVDDESHAPCRSTHGVSVAEAWTCQPKSITAYLPLMQQHANVGGDGWAAYVVGHEFGHFVDSRQPRPSPDANAEALADCLSGVAADATGNGGRVLAAVDRFHGASSPQHNSVKYGITNGYRACIDGAK